MVAGHRMWENNHQIELICKFGLVFIFILI